MDALMRYLETDTIWCVDLDLTFDCVLKWGAMDSFPHDSPTALVRLQKEHWDPLFTWVKDEFGIELSVAEGLLPAKQNEKALNTLREVLRSMDVWELAGDLSPPFFCTRLITTRAQRSSARRTPQNRSSSR